MHKNQPETVIGRVDTRIYIFTVVIYLQSGLVSNMYLYIAVLFLVSIRGVLGLPTPPQAQAQSPLTPQPQPQPEWPLGTILWVKPIHLDESSRFGTVCLCYHVRRVQCSILAVQTATPYGRGSGS